MKEETINSLIYAEYHRAVKRLEEDKASPQDVILVMMQRQTDHIIRIHKGISQRIGCE